MKQLLFLLPLMIAPGDELTLVCERGDSITRTCSEQFEIQLDRILYDGEEEEGEDVEESEEIYVYVGTQTMKIEFEE